MTSHLTLVSDRDPHLDEWETWQYARSLSDRTVTDRSATVVRISREVGTNALDLNSQQIAKWLARPGWSASTRATYHAHLKSWFVWLMLMEYRESNPMTKVGAPRRPRGEPKPVANEHMPVLVQTRMHRKTRVMVHLAALAGLRVHEIARVRGEDVDIIAKTITVVGKGEVTAVLPLHPDLVELAKTMPRRGWWFPSRGGRLPHMAPKSVTNTLCGLMIRAEIPGSGHRLRHWFATMLVRAGVDLRTVQELMRHASLQTTQIYTLVADLQKVTAVELLQFPSAEIDRHSKEIAAIAS